MMAQRKLMQWIIEVWLEGFIIWQTQDLILCIVALSLAEVLLICSYKCTIRSIFVKKNTLWYATKWKSSNHHTLGQYVNHSHDKKFNVSQSNTTHWTSSSLHQKIGARRWNTIGISQYKWAATRSFHKSHHIRKFVEFKKNMRITN